MAEKDRQWLMLPPSARERLVIVSVVLVLMAALGGVTWNLLQRSDEGVDAVKSVKVVNVGDPSRVESPISEREETDRQAQRDYQANPRATELSYKGLRLTDAGLRYVAGMSNLRNLALASTDITDHGIPLLAKLPLTTLDLTATHISDYALETVSHIQTLEKLYISDTAITSEGVSHLVHLHHLRDLDMAATKIDNRALNYLCEITSLQSLSLADNAITEDALAPLTKLPSLNELDLANTKLTVAGAHVLANLKAINTLTLRYTGFADEGLKIVATNKHLDTLNLSDTLITDRGLLYLINFHRLAYVRLDNCRNVTDKGVAALKARMPGLKVRRDPDWRQTTQVDLLKEALTRSGKHKAPQ